MKRAIPLLAAALFGVSVGFVLPMVAAAETRWQVYVVGGLIFASFLPLARNAERFLWIAFLFTFQINVSLRFFYGHAGSEGIVLPLAFLMGIAWLVVSGQVKRLAGFNWGGRFSLPILLLFLTGAASVLLSGEHFVGTSELFTHLQYYFMFLVALNGVRSEERFRLTIATLLIVGILQSLIYYAQSALGITFTMTGEVIDKGDLPRPGGTVATNPSGYASFLLPLLMIGVASFVFLGSTKTMKRIGVVVACLGAGTIVLTLTRASWFAFVLGLAVLMVLALRRGQVAPRRFAAIVTIVLIACLLAAPMIVRRLDQAPLGESLDERFDLMRMAAVVISANPVTGVGLGAYGHTYRAYLGAESAGKWSYVVHNYYLLRTAETGILGGIALVLFLIVALRESLRLSHARQALFKTAGLGIAAGVVALSFEIYWDTATGFPHNALLWFLCGLTIAGQRLAAASRTQTAE